MFGPKLQESIGLYEKTFKDSFPTIPFSSQKEEKVIEIIRECLEKKKDVYDLGYLSLEGIQY